MDLAVILTHNRPELLRYVVSSICPQVHRVCVIDNASDPPITFKTLGPCAHTLIHDPTQPPNLAELMNAGFDWAERQAKEWSVTTWNVAMLCDDLDVPPDWFIKVKLCMRELGATAGSTHQQVPVPAPLVKHTGDGDIYNRMQGSAFVVAGEHGLRADVNMRWWWQDTDLDWQARGMGGMVICPGPVVTNTRPNDFTYSVPGLAEQSGRDGEYFAAKWGWRPW